MHYDCLPLNIGAYEETGLCVRIVDHGEKTAQGDTDHWTGRLAVIIDW